VAGPRTGLFGYQPVKLIQTAFNFNHQELRSSCLGRDCRRGKLSF